MNLSELIGKTLKERYRIIEMLGQSGMGAVFRARDLVLDRALAIKIMIPSEGSSIDIAAFGYRFAREAKLAASLRDSPHIAQVFDVDWLDGNPYLVMEYIAGKDLSEIIASRAPLSLEQALEIVEQICLALQDTERAGIIHCNINPKNIRLLDYQTDGKIRVKILDFGLAKRFDQTAPPDEKDTQWTTGLLMGTLTHIAPEQISPALAWEGPNAVQQISADAPKQYPAMDGRVDLYAVGVILYELLSNRLPFEGTPQSLLTAHLSAPPPPLPASVPPKLAKLTMRLLAKCPADRVQTASELLAELRGCLPPLVPARPVLLKLWLSITACILGIGLLWLLLRGRCDKGPPTLSPQPAASRELAARPLPSSVPADLSKPADLNTPDLAPSPPTPRPKPVPSKPVRTKPQPKFVAPKPPDTSEPCQGGYGPGGAWISC